MHQLPKLISAVWIVSLSLVVLLAAAPVGMEANRRPSVASLVPLSTDFYDDFTDPASGWMTHDADCCLIGCDNGTMQEHPNYKYNLFYGDGRYHVKIPLDCRAGGKHGDTRHIYPLSIAPGVERPTTRTCIELKGGFEQWDPHWSFWGLVFAASADKSIVWSLEVNNIGDWAVVKRTGYDFPGPNDPFQNENRSYEVDYSGRERWPAQPAFETNILKAEVDGQNVKLHINGEQVHEFSASEIGSLTRVGIIGGDWEITPTQIGYEYFQLDVGCDGYQEPTPTPTPVFDESVYLPSVLRLWPPIPEAPALYAIGTPGEDRSYTVSWNAAEHATSYVLQEATNSAFSDAVSYVIGGATTYRAVSDQGTGRYYYRVKARNSWGDSPWSNMEWVDVLWEAEPNGHEEDVRRANGPLVSGKTYRSYPNDQDDYFYFELSSQATVNVLVEQFAPTSSNGTVQLWGPAVGDERGDQIDYYGEPGDRSMALGPHSLGPGKYYIRVYTADDHSTTEPYHLRVTY